MVAVQFLCRCGHVCFSFDGFWYGIFLGFIASSASSCLALWAALWIGFSGLPVVMRGLQFMASRHFPPCPADDKLELVAVP